MGEKKAYYAVAVAFGAVAVACLAAGNLIWVSFMVLAIVFVGLAQKQA